MSLVLLPNSRFCSSVKEKTFQLEASAHWQNDIPQIKVINTFPHDRGYHAEIRGQTKRGTAYVLQQPTPENNFELRINVLEFKQKHEKIAPVSFDVYAVPTSEVKHPYNVVIITIDTLRPDHKRITVQCH